MSVILPHSWGRIGPNAPSSRLRGRPRRHRSSHVSRIACKGQAQRYTAAVRSGGRWGVRLAGGAAFTIFALSKEGRGGKDSSRARHENEPNHSFSKCPAHV